MSTPTIDKLQRELDEARAKVAKAEAAALAARKQAEAERDARLDDYYRTKVTGYDRAALDAGIADARAQLVDAIKDDPVFSAWARYAAAVTIRLQAYIEAHDGARRLGYDWHHPAPPPGERVRIEQILTAVDDLAGILAADHQDHVDAERTAAADGK